MISGGIVGLVFLVLGAALWSYQYQQTSETPSAARLAQPEGDKPSIAVLPFVSMAGESDPSYFAEGISDASISGRTLPLGMPNP